MPSTRYQVRVGHGEQITNVVITLNIVKPFCRYGVNRVMHLHNEVFYRISAPECNVPITRIWANNLPSGLSIDSNDGSIEGVVNENSEKVATIFVNNEYNNQTFTFKNDFTTPFRKRLQLVYYDGNIGQDFSCINGYTYPDQVQRFFNGFYMNENKRIGPKAEDFNGDVFNVEVTADSKYNYKSTFGFHGVYGFLRIKEEGSYIFKVKGDDCIHFYFYGTEPADRAIATRYYYEESSSKSYYLYPGYYPIFLMLGFDGSPNGYEIWTSKDGGDFEYFPLSESYSLPEANGVDKLRYAEMVRTLSEGETLVKRNDIFPIFEGYGEKFSIKGESTLEIDANNGHYTGTVSGCPKITYGVIKMGSTATESSAALRVECGGAGNVINKEIVVSTYKAESLLELKSFVDPSATPTYVKRISKYTNSITLDESLLTESNVIEWRGTVYGNGDKKVKVSCEGACYVRVASATLNVFGSDSDKSEGTAKMSGYNDIIAVYYRTDDAASGFSLTFNDAEVTDTGDVYVARKADLDYMRTDVLYANLKLGSSQSFKISHYGDQEPESYALETKINGLSISGSTISFAAQETISPTLVIYVATLNGYEFRSNVTVGGYTVYEESYIRYDEKEFIGNVGDAVTINPSDIGNCAYIYSDTNLPSGLSIDVKTGVISGYYMESITKDVNIICDTYSHKTETPLSFTIGECENGGEIVHIVVTAGPDPALFTDAVYLETGADEGRFATETDKKPYQDFHFYICSNGNGYLTINSKEAIKGTYLVERGYGAFVKKGTYQDGSVSIEITLDGEGAPVPSYTDSSSGNDIGKVMTFYTNVQTSYFLKVGGKGAVAFVITPDLKIPGLTMDEYGTISGMATETQEKVYTFKAVDHEEVGSEIQFTIVIKDCDKVSVNVYFPFIGKSYEDSSSKNDGFRLTSGSTYLLYQDGPSTTKSNYQLCLDKGQYSLELVSKNSNGWVDSYIRVYVNGKETFNAIYSPEGPSTYSLNLNTFTTETQVYLLKYTDYVSSDSWKTGINTNNAISANIYNHKVGEVNNHYTITRYYNYEFNVNVNAPIYRFTVHYEYGVAMYVNGFEIFREYLSAGNLTLSTPCSGDRKDTTRTIDVPASILKSGTNILAVELHRNAVPGSDDIAKDTFRIESVTEINGLDSCYNLIMSDSYSRISDTSMADILDGAKYTKYSGEAKTDPLTITFKNLVSINDFKLIGTGENPPTTISATARLGSTTKSLIKVKTVELGENQMMSSIATEVNMPIDTITLTFGSGGGNMEIADFIPRYCIGFCPAVTEGEDSWPAGRRGDTVEIACKLGYEGSKTRLCSESGVYEAVNDNCNPSPQLPVFKYDKTEYAFTRGDNIAIEKPKLSGVSEDSVSYEIVPDIKLIFPDLTFDTATGEIYGEIKPSYETGNQPETPPPVTNPPETQPPETQPPETQPPETASPERRNRNRLLSDLIHKLSQEYTITAKNLEKEELTTTNKITISAEDPKCDAQDGFPETYVGETVEGVKCPILMIGYVQRKCEFKNYEAYFGEDDYSVCEHKVIGACPFYGTGNIYKDVINRIYHTAWQFAVTEVTPLDCYESNIGGQKVDCPEFLKLQNNGTIIVEGVSEKFDDVYVTYKVNNPNKDTKQCDPGSRLQIRYMGQAVLINLEYKKAEFNYSLADNEDTLIEPKQVLSGIDHCISEPALPAGITFDPDYFNYGGRILVRPIGASAGTYKITCGNRVDSKSTTISINVNAPSCSNAEYGVLEIGGTKTLSCGKNKHGKIVIYCDNDHEFKVRENTCQDSKPTSLKYGGGKAVTFYQNVQAAPQKVEHDGDVGVAKFTTECNIPGLSVHPYLGYLIGTPTQLQNTQQHCLLSLTQDQTVNTTIDYYVRQGYCTYMGEQINPGQSHITDCAEGETGQVIKRCPQQPNASGGYTIVDESTCRKLRPVTFIYPTKSLVLKVDKAMDILRPTLSSTATFSVEPDLPDGIELNAETGVVSGTATAMQDTKEYTFYAFEEWKNPFKMSIRIVDKTCPQEGGFPETPIGSDGAIPCTNGNDGYEKRRCNEDQTWSEKIDDSECADAEPELFYPDTPFSFFVNVEIEPIVYVSSVGIITYVADGLPEGLSINQNGEITGTPTSESGRMDYKIVGMTRKSQEIETFVSIEILGSFCAANGGFNNTAAGETVFLPCTSSTTWGVTSRKCLGPEETGKDAAEWEPAIECNKTEPIEGRKEYQFNLNITKPNIDDITLDIYNAVYDVVYDLLQGSFEKDISSLMYYAYLDEGNKLVYRFFIYTSEEEAEVKDIISQLINQQSMNSKLIEKDFAFFYNTQLDIDQEVQIVNIHSQGSDDEDDELPLAMIIGIAGGAVVLILIICVCIICCRMRSAKQSTFSREVPKAKKAARA